MIKYEAPNDTPDWSEHFPETDGATRRLQTHIRASIFEMLHPDHHREWSNKPLTLIQYIGGLGAAALAAKAAGF